MEKKKYATVLSIAGSDSIGGAGIQADIKTCTALGVYAMTAITAVTAQNTCGVNYYEPTSERLLRGQLEAILADVHPDAVKIGMLPNTEAVGIVADAIISHRLTNIVLDPVCVATSGDSLAADSVPGAIKRRLLGLSTLVTPNIPEAEILSGIKIEKPHDLHLAAQAILESGAKAVLIKGGHLEGKHCIDHLYIRDLDAPHLFDSERITTPNTHGTGCTLSSAIASYLAMGKSLEEAVTAAKKYISAAIRAGAAYEFGKGHGPVCHFHTLTYR